MRRVGLGVTIVALVGMGVGCGDDPEPASGETAAREVATVEWAIAIHGGAGVIPKTMPEEAARARLDALRSALALGSGLLAAGTPALEVVERVVIQLEDEPVFNAGKGAVFTADGRHELDAAIMDGRTLACGSVAGLTTVKNPIMLARKVMTESPHVFLVGTGAEDFATQVGVERVEPSYFSTEERRRELEEALAREAAAAPPAGDLGTVGAVALDRAGDLAAATSTGGRTAKRWGRVGDVPVIGAGTYASNRSAAVSGTGKGEQFIRHTVAREVTALVEYRGLSLADAAAEVIHRRLQPGDGGVIAVGKNGEIALVWNSEGMYRGAADSRGRSEVAIWE